VSPLSLRDEFVAALRPLLLASPLLPTIARLQRTLDSLDVEGLHALLDRAGAPFSKEQLENDVNVNPFFIEPDVAEWSAFVTQYQARQRKAARGVPVDPKIEDVRYHTLAFLLSMSFKDCSVICNLHPDGEHLDTVTVIDLDPKTVRKLAQWERIDSEIVRAYAQVPEEKRKHCVDAHALPHVVEEAQRSSAQFLIIVTIIITLLSYVLMPR
jgi:inositol-pentakisphosphate 2-kinase